MNKSPLTLFQGLFYDQNNLLNHSPFEKFPTKYRRLFLLINDGYWQQKPSYDISLKPDKSASCQGCKCPQSKEWKILYLKEH